MEADQLSCINLSIFGFAQWAKCLKKCHLFTLFNSWLTINIRNTSRTRNSMERRNSKTQINTFFIIIILELCSFVKTTNATTDFASKAMKKEERSALIWNLEMPYRNIGSDVTIGCAILPKVIMELSQFHPFCFML